MSNHLNGIKPSQKLNINLQNHVQHTKYVFRLSRSEIKYLTLECACARNIFYTLNLDLEAGVKMGARRLRAECICGVS